MKDYEGLCNQKSEVLLESLPLRRGSGLKSGCSIDLVIIDLLIRTLDRTTIFLVFFKKILSNLHT